MAIHVCVAIAQHMLPASQHVFSEMPDETRNRFFSLTDGPRTIPMERQSDPGDVRETVQSGKQTKPTKRTQLKSRSKESMDEEKRLGRSRCADRKRKEAEEKEEDPQSEKVQKKNTPEKENEEASLTSGPSANPSMERRGSILPVPARNHTKSTELNASQQQTDTNAKGGNGDVNRAPYRTCT